MIRPSAFITTDCHTFKGGEYDDLESFWHLVLFSDRYNLVGISCSVPRGTKDALLPLVDAYKSDFRRGMKERPEQWQELIKPIALRKIICNGQRLPGKTSEVSEGVKRLVSESKKGPLYILVWGACTDLATAISCGLNMRNCRVHFIASWNREQDKASYEILLAHKKHFAELIINETTFRGFYIGAESKGRLGTTGFMNFVKKHGHFGKAIIDTVRSINSKAIFKCGDTCSVLWLLDEIDGSKPRRAGRYPNGFDSTSPRNRLSIYAGAAQLARQRKRFIREIVDRVKLLYGDQEDAND